MDWNPLDLLAEIPGLEGLLFATLVVVTLLALLGSWLATARRKYRPDLDPARDASALLPFRVRFLKPAMVTVVAAGFASIALVQSAARVLDIPISGGDRFVRLALQIGPIGLLAIHVARAKDATQAIARSLREGTMIGALSCVVWRMSREDGWASGIQYDALAGAAAGFVVGAIIAVVAAGAAHFRASRMHDASERMLAHGAAWLLGVGAISLVSLRGYTAANDRVVCVVPLLGALLLATPALVWDVARRGWIESVRGGREEGFRIAARMYGADHHERLVAMRSPLAVEQADGVIEWQAEGLGAPFRSKPPVPVALASLRPAGPLVADGAVLSRVSVLLVAIVACCFAMAEFAEALL